MALKSKLYKYSISIEDLNKLELAQTDDNNNIICAICFQILETYHIDHDHLINKVRGLLCSSCNTFLGAFNDDPNLLLKAEAYIRKSILIWSQETMEDL